MNFYLTYRQCDVLDTRRIFHGLLEKGTRMETGNVTEPVFSC
jgi:hypothetical protein